ncbi:MAG: hypothetical protein IPG25_12440 [Proteobacteria bacterium]|nr:hypothetical protein [Pseudomonadota bacterium]
MTAQNTDDGRNRHQGRAAGDVAEIGREHRAETRLQDQRVAHMLIDMHDVPHEARSPASGIPSW